MLILPPSKPFIANLKPSPSLPPSKFCLGTLTSSIKTIVVG